MKKKQYEKPSSKVYELKHRPQLLQSSGERNPYGDPTNWNWE
jgi:hypothetical protein